MLPSSLLKKWEHIQNNGTLDILKFEELESELDHFGRINKVEKTFTSDNENNFFSFAIGSEETGHNITYGSLIREDGKQIPGVFGNGLKNAINTFVATQLLLESKPMRTYFSALSHPFPTGFKQTFYTYYIKNIFFSAKLINYN